MPSFGHSPVTVADMAPDLRQSLGKAPLTSFQVAAVVVCVVLNMLDGFDILAMSFCASSVKSAWQLSDSELGALLSAGLLGMGAGSLLLGPCADRWGRRPIVLLSMTLASLGMVGATLARGYSELLWLRFLTGLGIGGTIASVAVLVSEYSPDRWRSAALAAYATGYPIGATVGGALTALAIPHYGWRAAFAVGGTLSIALLLVAFFRLPESLDFLLTHRPPRALQRVNVLLMRMRLAALDALPETTPIESGLAGIRPRLALLVSGANLLVWVLFFSTMAGFYFIVSWTPRLLGASGLGASHGLTAGVLLNLGGIAGCALFALVATRLSARRLLFASLLVTGALVVIFGLTLTNLTLALAAALLLGIVSNSAMSGLYAVGPPLYPAAARATGMGWAIGVGRVGAILAPLGSGVLLDHGWAPARLYALSSVPFIVAAICMLAIRREASG
ncbi:MAG: MFS transporter [Proteobacteria bacterium]|nr:MFS transporter [Pseudomonadota bacterium]